ncbi:MAG: DUF1735 domain-containing protein [Bacteroidales bacterium]
MKRIHNIKIATLLVAIGFLFFACIPEGVDQVGDAGSTLIKFLPGDFTTAAINATTESQTVPLFEVRRDVNSTDAMTKSTTVTLKFDVDTTMLKAYNQGLIDAWVAEDTANHPEDYDGPQFIPLPQDYYSVDPAPDANGIITLNFAPGEFTKSVMATVPNSTLFDFSALYGVPFQIVSVTGEGVISEGTSDVLVCQILAKNKYDGLYEVTANSPMVDILNATLTGLYPFIYSLETTGANTVLCVDRTIWDAPFHPILSGTSASGYGSFGFEIEFDPATDEVIAMYNVYGNPPANTRMPVIDPSGENKLVNGVMNFKYWMIQPSLVPTPPNIRTYFDEKWTYQKPR